MGKRKLFRKGPPLPSWNGPQYRLSLNGGASNEGEISFHDDVRFYLWVGTRAPGGNMGIGICEDHDALREFATTLLRVLDRHQKPKKRRKS